MNHPEEPMTVSQNSKESPIEKLDFDVLRCIFLIFNDTESRVGSHRMAILLSHVCRRWRMYTLDVPIMWNTLNFERSGPVRDWWKQKTFLERSSSAPLDIRIWSGQERNTLLSASAVAGIFRILKPHLHRWRSLEISLHSKGLRVISDLLNKASAPALEVLILDIWEISDRTSRWRCRIFGGGFPNLRIWKSSPGLLHPLSIAPQLDNLRVFGLKDRGWDDSRLQRATTQEVLSVLLRCPKVEELDWQVSRILKTPSPTPPSATPIWLYHLVSLKVGTHMRSFTYLLPLLDYIKAPNLLSIDCEVAHNSIIPIIASSNPFPGLQILSLTQVFWHTMESLPSYETSVLQNLFTNLSSLRDLVFRSQRLHNQLFQTLQRCCPNLINLSLEECTLLPADLIGMVRARMESSVLSSLDRLRIYKLRHHLLSKEDTTFLASNIPQFILKEEDGS